MKPFSLKKIAKKITNLLSNKFDRDEFMRLMILEESKLGADIFGPRRPGYRRDFFMFNDKTWVWNEQIDSPSGPHIITTRYILKDGLVYKTQDGGPHELLRGEELRHFTQAVQIYSHKAKKLYATL